MEQAVAAAVVRTTRERAEASARDDLTALRRRAIEAGRQRSRDFVKVTTINQDTGQIRQNPAGRVLRDWYLHVYLNTLRARLGQPSEQIDAQQVEDTARLLRRLKPNAEPLRALQAVGVARNVALADAANSVAKITERLREIGEARAIRHAPDDRFDGDDLRICVTRHWFKRCYDDFVEEAVSARHPLAGVTAAEEHEVAVTMATGEARRLIGRDGIPLMTEFGTKLTALDKQLATEGVLPVSREVTRLPVPDATAAVAARVGQAWDVLQRDVRDRWLVAANAKPIEYDMPWARLDRGQQVQLLRHYVTMHERQFRNATFSGDELAGEPADQARMMFGHSHRLEDLSGSTDTRRAGLGSAVEDRAGASEELRISVRHL